MKKTLVALAVLAAAGTAFAQSTVTVSGKYRIAYHSDEKVNGDKVQGIGVTDGDVVFGSVEDLGAGMKASASLAVRVRGRAATVDGSAGDTGIRARDASVSLSGGFGTVTMGSIDIGFLHSAALTSLPAHGLDDNVVILAGNNYDLLRYSSPDMSGFTVSLAVLDKVGAGGAESKSDTQDATVLGARYSAGPILVVGDYTSYDANNAAAPLGDNRYRLAGTYDFGAAKIGLGYSNLKFVGGVKRTETVGSVTVPMGAVSFALNVARSETDGISGTNEGTEAVVKYDLSKRTFLAAAYQATKAAVPTVVSGVSRTEANRFRVQIGHSF